MSRRSLITGLLLFISGLIGFAVGTAQELTPPPKTTGPQMKTLEEKAAYAIGLDIGRNIASGSGDLNPDLIAKGLLDAMKKAKPALTDEEIQATMAEFGKKMRTKEAARIAASDPAAAKNLKEGQDFLAANKEKKGVVTTASGLQYQVISEGKGASPKKTDVVRVHYHGTLTNGKVFDSSVERKKPEEFPVNQVIPGWTEALQKMKVGDKWKVFVPSELAYGPESRGEVIRPFSVLVFDVELLEIVK